MRATYPLLNFSPLLLHLVLGICKGGQTFSTPVYLVTYKFFYWEFSPLISPSHSSCFSLHPWVTNQHTQRRKRQQYAETYTLLLGRFLIHRTTDYTLPTDIQTNGTLACRWKIIIHRSLSPHPLQKEQGEPGWVHTRPNTNSIIDPFFWGMPLLSRLCLTCCCTVGGMLDLLITGYHDTTTRLVTPL